MPEDEKEKAEKIAAAKKRYEQLKKQKAKKTPAKADDTSTKPAKEALTESKNEPASTTKAASNEDDSSKEAPSKADKDESDANGHKRQPSLTQESRLRSSSFRAGLKDNLTSPTVRSPTLTSGPLSPAADAADVYRKQSQRIEELEKDNKSLQKDVAKLRDLEVEVQELRENKSASVVDNVTAASVEKLETELSALKRQNAQLTQQLGSKKQRQESLGTADLSMKADLESKSAAIEALELDLSSANTRLASQESRALERDAKIQELDSQLEKSEAASLSATAELQELKARLESRPSKQAGSQFDQRLNELEALLAAARRATTEAESRAERLDQKITTLNTLHREAESRHAVSLIASQTSDREIKELRGRVATLQTESSKLRDEAARRVRYEASGDADGLDEIEDEERQRLSIRVRELEEENFDLRRGVWRDARKNLQPGLDGQDGGFDDVDLSSSTRDRGLVTPRSVQRNHSTFADVINSGINAFTAAPTRARQASLNVDELADDDDLNFDEDAFRKAHEEEAKARLERVKNVKRGLPKWHGWRVDLVDLRTGLGGVFDV